MNDKYDKWIGNSQYWRDQLEKSLEMHGGNDVVTPYTNVAFAFPSRNPSPHSFDYPLIDQRGLMQWAESKGWEVRLAPKMAEEKDKHSPPVRFTKQ